MNISGQRVLITGGAGFIGSQIAELLVAEKPAAIVAVDNMVRGRRENVAHLPSPFRLVEGDICDHDLMNKLVAESDIVFHMAALRITHSAAEPKLAFDVMARASFDLFQLCIEHKIKKIVAASSASIYGLAERFPTDEACNPYDNRTLYGAFKTMLEGVLRSFHDMYGLNYCAMRYFNVYGPRMDMHGKYTEVLIRWMERLEQGLPPIIFGDGMQTMDFVHVRDVGRANILAMKADITDEVFNVASGREVSLRDLALALMKVMGRDNLAIDYQAERAVNPVPRRLADTTKAEKMLGFRSEIGLEDGLRDVVTWWRGQRQLQSGNAA